MTAYGAGIAVLLALLGGVLALAARVPGEGRRPAGRAALKRLAAAHYVETVVVAAAAVILGSLALGLWRVFPIGVDLLGQLREVGSDPDAARAVVIALAAALAAVGILGAIVVGAIRVWINERSTRSAERTTQTAEANLITGLINTAVEGLGAEKRISRIGRAVTFRERDVDDPADPLTVTEIEWLGDGLVGRDHTVREEGNWQTFEFTAPNLEVRIGAIYTMERIARDNPREHSRVFKIVCAYVRENSKSIDARDHSIGELFEGYPKYPSDERLSERRTIITDRRERLFEWINGLVPLRTDIQTALTVIGDRALENDSLYSEGPVFKIDLRATNLRRADLSFANLDGALMSGARLEGANLNGTHLRNADISDARLQLATLAGAKLAGALLNDSHLEYANLSNTEMDHDTTLKKARIDGAFLRGAEMQGVDLDQASMREVDLRRADLRSIDLITLIGFSGRVHAADLRNTRIDQEKLDHTIGDDFTLLPDKNFVPEPYYVWSCWVSPWDDFYADPIGPSANIGGEQGPRINFRCSSDNARKVGAPLALDAPYPEGHPLANRDCPPLAPPRGLADDPRSKAGEPCASS